MNQTNAISLSDLVSSLTTLVAAFLGAWFAFRIQNKHEREKQRENNLLSLNMIQIHLFQQYNDLLIINRDFSTTNENREIDWITIPAMSHRNPPTEIDISSISFMIEKNNISIIPKILLAIEKYDECVKLINSRSELHLNVLQKGIESIRKKHIEEINKETLINEIGEKSVGEIMNLTEQIKSILPDTISYYRGLINEIYTIGLKMFPQKTIINIRDST